MLEKQNINKIRRILLYCALAFSYSVLIIINYQRTQMSSNEDFFNFLEKVEKRIHDHNQAISFKYNFNFIEETPITSKEKLTYAWKPKKKRRSLTH
jgi:hypothetical protein